MTGADEDHGGHHGDPQVDGEHDDHAGHGADHSGHEEMFRKRFWVSTALSFPVLFWSETIQAWFGYTAPEFLGSFLIVPVLATFIFVYGGFPFLSLAVFELKKRSPGMMTLISLAITVAYGFSMLTLIVPTIGDDFFWELVTLIDIMLLGHWMEMRSVRQASGSLGALAKLMPDTADVEGPNGVVTTIPVGDLMTEQIVLIRPGASVPADGVVTDGESDFDEALITGESRPVKKLMGETVIGGTINSGSGAVRARVTATGDDTALSGIMLLVAEAEASKSPTQLLADRAASLLFYMAVGAAVLTAVIWTVIYGGFDERMIARVVTVLVIACPHALGLAIPLVVSNTTGIAAENGILIRKREAIDTARNLDVIVFDKTGTLTTGQMGVADIATIDGVSKESALALAAAVEGDSEHPMARAIRDSAVAREIAVPEPEGFEALKGRGVRASVDGSVISVGGPRLVESMDVVLPGALAALADSAGARGESVVYVIESDSPIAAIAISDLVRTESDEAIKALKGRGVSVGMMTGDSDDVARAVADELDLDIVLSQVLPADKDAHVSRLQENGDNVGMVGDGVNDAPALVRADIGIAIGSGTDVAVQSADLVLVSDDPRGVVKILRLSAASYRKQLQNIWWGAGYNIVMIPLAAGILVPWGFDMPPAVGALFMSLSTIIVAVNAQMLRRVNLDVD
ncbi:MAG: copper-translocating P-type ATPase [Actinomycetia bacterium]|nr:copper-translocating P-type ATPase [Actinomycetes bacterium]